MFGNGEPLLMDDSTRLLRIGVAIQWPRKRTNMHFAPYLMASVLFLGLPASPDTRPTAAANPKFESKQLVEDFHILRKALEDGHSGIYRYAPKVDLDALFEQTEKRLDRPMDCVDFYRIVAPVIAAVKCGHTAVLLPEQLRSGPKSKKLILPLQVRVLEGRVYVLRDFSGDNNALAGKEIRNINSVPVSTVLETMLKATPGDGDVPTSRLHRIRGFRFCSLLVDLLGLNPPYALTIWDSDKKESTTVKLPGVEVSRLLAASQEKFPEDQPSQTTGEFRFAEGDRIGILKINGFRPFMNKNRQKKTSDFFQESFAALHQKDAKTLIIDLRNNGGGEDELGKLLLSYLVDKPFKYYDDLVINALRFEFQKYTADKDPLPAEMLEHQPNGKYRLVKHPNWGMQQPSTPHFAGKVLILINGGSFSTTSEFLSHVHFRKRATFIGEESGGAYYGNTSGPSAGVTLPNTKLLLEVPLMTYYMSVNGNPAAARGVVPDVPVSYSIQDLLAGKDKEMEIAIDFAKRR